MAPPVQQQLLKILQKVDRPGTFCTSGLLPATLPGLKVAGVGSIALPLEKKQAAALKKRAHQAPYGKGTRTLVDTDVRRVWEIDAEQVVLANPQWDEVLQQAVRTTQVELGLEKLKLRPHLYKLLLYETGSFFVAHRDGEKLERMVATLVIALPSAHQGGELVVRHEGREKVIDFGPRSAFQTQFAAFYADCEHEIRPVTGGFRLTLVYNLTLERAKKPIAAPTSGEAIEAAARALSQWSSERAAASAPTKLAVLLDHQYTQAGLTRDVLKGLDRARADVLFAAAREAICDASLALVTWWESGAGEPTEDYGYGYDRHGWYDEEGEEDEEEDEGGEYEMQEVFESSLTAAHFSDAEGNALAFGEIPLDEAELVSAQPLNEGTPDKEEFEGYTGNAGMTLDRWYHRAAVVIWPAETRFDVLCEAGVEAAVGGLEHMVREWREAEKSEREVFKQLCIEFADRILAHWPERKYASGYPPGPGPAAYDDPGDEDLDEAELEEEDDDSDDFPEESSSQVDHPAGNVAANLLLCLLGELGDASPIAAWIREVLARDATVVPDKVLGDVCKQHGWRTFRDELREVFANTSNDTLERNARLLADWALGKDKDAERARLCSELAQQLLAAVEHWSPRPAHQDWQARRVDPGELLPPLVQAFLALDEPKLLERLVDHVLDRPKEFDLTTVQVPVLLGLAPWLKRHVKQPSAALHRWLAAIVEELEDRKAHPPKEPTDWRRESATGCKCADCKELSRFLEDPKQQTLRLPLAEQRRRHLHNVIDQRKLDTTHVTERRGRPYTLVCTKTRGSYERAFRAHQVDLDQLAKTRKLLAWDEGL